MARLINSAIGAPVFSDIASNFLSCSSLRYSAVLFMARMLPYRHTCMHYFLLRRRSSHSISVGCAHWKRTYRPN